MKSKAKKNITIELSRDVIKRVKLEEGDWLVVKMLEGKEVVLEKPKTDYWDETFAWGKNFAKAQKLKRGSVQKAVNDLRSGK
ncbi:MAG: hypothetical protein ABIH69_01955 [bacterium]